ncbi:F-box/kelch-repeat protein At3g06240-like isoform X2 [Castanea sativa]|uniref:F-box/kelch-repeat protein At3g06240-like isoform X2 n=1 Tax=Castanea sativa TaxID=21020 RepID=UPI003F654488
MSRPTEKLRLLTERVLDDDIVFDILTRLPVKSLIRFRCDENNGDHVIYLWNPSIRKFKMLAPALLTDPFDGATLGLAYHSQKNDFKILRLVTFQGSLEEPDPPTEAEVYTLSTDSWRKVVLAELSDLNVGYIYHQSPYIFLNGALHCIVANKHCSFILSFDINDERFHKIMLPLDFLDVYQSYLTVFKGSLAYIILSNHRATVGIMCHLWVMKEYGVAESWTRKCVPIDWCHHFHGCTDNGELLITICTGLISIDPENLLQNSLITEFNIRWVCYAANSIESLVLLDGVNVSSEYED